MGEAGERVLGTGGDRGPWRWWGPQGMVRDSPAGWERGGLLGVPMGW